MARGDSEDRLTRRRALQGIAAGVGTLATSGCAQLNRVLLPDRLRADQARRLLSSVDHFVVLMMENRSFDHVLGSLALDPEYPSAHRIDGIHPEMSNADRAGNTVPVFPLKADSVADPPHSWSAAHLQLNQGRNDDFVRAFQTHHPLGGNPREVMGYYERAQLPVLHALADQYTVCDRWFSSVLGPTWPNRFYLHAGTSFGLKTYQPVLQANAPTLWEGLASRGIHAVNYFAGALAWYSGGFLGKTLTRAGLKPERVQRFFKDAEQGTLPSLSIIDPDFSSRDDHPPHSMKMGQAFIATVARAIGSSPRWNRTLLVITYDEHGGFFDHVVPPTAEDDFSDFQQLGFRVPTLLVGPMVRRGQVDSTVFDHTSIAATLATRFGLGNLGRRMNAAEDLSSAIDPGILDGAAPLPAPRLPKVILSREELRASDRSDSQPELTALRVEVPENQQSGADPEQRLRQWTDTAQALEVLEIHGV